MNKSNKRLTRAALLTALGCALLYVSSVIPSGRIAVIAVSGLLTAAALIHCGLYSSIAVFTVTSVLSMLIIPLKSCGILYAAFFGYYPIVKSVLERLKSRKLEWILKLAIYNIALSLILFLGKGILLPGEVPSVFEKMLIVGYIIMNAVFLIYDRGITKLIAFYIIRISKHIDK